MKLLSGSRALRPALVAAAVVLGCSPPEAPPPASPRTREPEIRVGVAVGVEQVRLGAPGRLAVLDSAGGVRAEVPAGESVTVRGRAGGLAMIGALSWNLPAGETITFAPLDPDRFIEVDGRPFRGRVTLVPERDRVTAVNQLGMESYLAGVVPAEMGRRDSADLQALMAQAVISRTYALRNRGRWAARGFDLYATVADQVYGGVAVEQPLTWEAVTGTGGQVVTWDGAPIDAFFYSTCGGRTAEGTEVFANARRPYLVSVADTDPAGEAYCRISPRYEWRVEWSGEGLRDILRESVPAALGSRVASNAVIQSVRVAERSGSRRVASLTFTIDDRPVTARGPAVRQVLRPARGEILRSSLFELAEHRAGGRLVRLVADGHGAGHGVGFCQWGALGRARAGQSYREILTAYYPHTDLERIY